MEFSYRLTPQTKSVLEVVRNSGHLTNSELLLIVKKDFPSISSTTVHRITKRMIKYGILAEGPKINGVIIVDANVSSHDHFVCLKCNGVKDILINKHLRKDIQTQINTKILPTTLVIIGDCQKCT